MAIIYSYPIAQPLISDLLLGTHIDPERLHDGNPTKSFNMQDVITLAVDTTLPLVPIPGLQQVLTADRVATFTGNNSGIYIETEYGTAISGYSSYTGVGIQGRSESGIGISGNTVDGYGVRGSASDGYGIAGYNIDGIGVYGTSETGNGGAFVSESNAGVTGFSTEAVGVSGRSQSSYGGYFSSNTTYSLVAAQSAAKPGGRSWSATSDSRVKENINPYVKGLNELLLVNPVTYEYNGLAGTIKGTKYTGVIAQEIKDVFPETVSTFEAKLNETDKDKTELYDFNSTALTFALINAIKELNTKIDSLQSQIEELKTK